MSKPTVPHLDDLKEAVESSLMMDDGTFYDTAICFADEPQALWYKLNGWFPAKFDSAPTPTVVGHDEQGKPIKQMVLRQIIHFRKQVDRGTLLDHAREMIPEIDAALAMAGAASSRVIIPGGAGGGPVA